MKIRDITAEIELLAPVNYQESYDNAGLAVGDADAEINACLLCFDVTERIVDEAAERGAGLVISHHPVIFGGLKRITGRTAAERIVEKALRCGIALYAAHTNLDSVYGGINTELAQKLGLTDIRILSPRTDLLYKITVYTPSAHAAAVRDAMFAAGAGSIGNYDRCSWNSEGTGTFRAGAGANPFVGTPGQTHEEPETRTDVLVRTGDLPRILQAMIAAHPYEEPAYDVYKLSNALPVAGLGAVGNLPEPESLEAFFKRVKHVLNTKIIRHNRTEKKTVSRIAVCGGAGENFVTDAIAAGADVFLTGDCKYHRFSDTEGRLILADAGHFETEYFATEIFRKVISKKFPNFTVYISGNISNPVQYFL